MSWNGPVAGTAPYQPPHYTPGQPGYSQPQAYQYGQQPSYGQYQTGPPYSQPGPPQRPPDNRPPKKKGNPIITRYPPPPGYRGPAQPQAPFGANRYQPPQPGYPQGPPAPSSYPNQGFPTAPSPQGYPTSGYGPPQTQQGYPQGTNCQWPQKTYPPNTPYSQPPNYPGSSGYVPQNSYQGYPSQPAPTDTNQQAYAPTQGWQPLLGQPSYQSSSQFNSYGGPLPNSLPKTDPNATPTPSLAHIAISQTTSTGNQVELTSGETSVGERPQLFLAWDDWDFDFDGAIWPKANEPVDPSLSLGVIIWRPAKQVTRALPSTHADAEEQALKPPAEKLGNAESVSIYFTTENSHEAFLDVRQTDEWDKIKHDPIFVVFTEQRMKETLVSIEDCIAMRDRPDEPLGEVKENEDEEMHDPSWNVMDNLEQALSGQDEDVKDSTSNRGAHPAEQQTQEDILAMLGVTGSPKPPSDEPVAVPFPLNNEKLPASLPDKPPAPSLPQIPPRPEQPPQRSQSYGGHRNSSFGAPPQRLYGSLSASSRPPQSHERPRYDPWASGISENQSSSLTLDGSQQSPVRSEGSNRTFAGSDFEDAKPMDGVDQSATLIPQLKRSDSSLARKRSYDDTDQDDEKLRQQDDHMRRKRRSQVAAAYSRR